jgi:GNAT superfamily N-acetyltransferase
MQFMDMELARRVEMAEAFAGKACVEGLVCLRPDFPAAIEEVAGGIALFAGEGSPVTQAIGVGMNGPVGEEDLERLEAFFRSRGAAVAVELCPLVDSSLYEAFGKRGYRLQEVSNVLVRQFDAHDRFDGPQGVVVRPAKMNEARTWVETVAKGFAEDFPVTEPLLDVMQGFFHREGACSFLAYVGDEVAGGGCVSSHDHVGGLFGASTLPAFRRLGVQAALLAARLRWAFDQGCDLAASIALPGSVSQRNIERLGFRIAYTRTKLVKGA